MIELYVREDDLEKAFETVLDREDLEIFRQYRDPVAEIDPNTYFEAYQNRLESYLAADTGRDHYRTVIAHLEELGRLGLDEERRVFVERLREKHSNRPAFLDELANAGFQ